MIAALFCLFVVSLPAADTNRPVTGARTRDSDGNTPLHHVSGRIGNLDAVNRLIASKANVNVRNRLGQIPLHLAASCPRPAIVERLLEAKSDINARDRNGKTPLHYATIFHQDAVAALLRKRGARTTIKDRFGRTAADIEKERALWKQTLQTTGQEAMLKSICFGLDTFVTVGERGTILTSLDGFNWTPRECSYPYDFLHVDFVNGLFVALGEYGDSFFSEDSIIWTRRQIDTGDGVSFSAITYGRDRYVAVGPHADIFFSTDGLRWDSERAATDTDLT
jgi:hypothetical protein